MNTYTNTQTNKKNVQIDSMTEQTYMHTHKYIFINYYTKLKGATGKNTPKIKTDTSTHTIGNSGSHTKKNTNTH